MPRRLPGIQVSLATVYNTGQFTAVGLLREVAICEGHKAYFDANTSNHYHYYMYRARGQAFRRPVRRCQNWVGLPEAPDGMHIKRVDVIVRLSRLPEE